MSITTNGGRLMNTAKKLLHLPMAAACAFALISGYCKTHADGLPGEYLVTQRWRQILAEHSALTNPALLTEENYVTVRGAFSPILNSFRLWETGITVPVGLYQSAGVSWLGLHSGAPFSEFDEAGVEGGELTSQHNFFVASYAINPWNRLSAGINLSVAYDNIFGEKIISIPPGIDIGLSYRLMNHPFLGAHILGVSAQNLLAPKLTSSQGGDGEEYVRNLKFTWIASFLENKIENQFDFDVKDFIAQASEFQNGSTAIEYELYNRLGIWVFRVFRICALFGFGELNSAYVGAAAGLDVPSINMGRSLEFMYQFNKIFAEDDVWAHTVSMRAEIGKHREEIYARKVALRTNTNPSELYNKALRLYYKGQYWDAFFVFGGIVSQYPDFFKNDWVSYYLHNCREELGMQKSAGEGFVKTIEEYPKSEVVPFANLGVMRVAYRDNDHFRVSQQFSRMNQPGIPDSLKYHAIYLMAQSRFNEQRYDNALAMFDLIPAYHPEYPFAQHSRAVSHALDDNLDDAIAALENVIAFTPVTNAQKEIINRSYLLLGYIFYAKGTMSKAVTALRNIPATSIYYEDAQLGLGWSAIKSRQWRDCQEAGKVLANTSQMPVVRAEGMLMQAYSFMMEKQYNQARPELNRAIDLLKATDKPSEDSLALKKMTLKDTRERYDETAKSALQFAMAVRSSSALSSIDSLHAVQREQKRILDEGLRYIDNFQRRGFFARNRQKVLDDCEYAVATIDRDVAAGDAEKMLEKQRKEVETIDDEIEKARRELEMLEQEEE